MRRARHISAAGGELAHALVAACGRELAERYDLHQWDRPHPLPGALPVTGYDKRLT